MYCLLTLEYYIMMQDISEDAYLKQKKIDFLER